MSQYKSFVFKDYSFNNSLQLAEFTYSYDDILFFTEKITFNTQLENYNEQQLNIALQDLFIMSGISYYKAYLPDTIIIEPFELNKERANFFSRTYQKGLRELFYRNNLPVNKEVDFPYSESENNNTLISNNNTSGFLVAIGGGKDSLVSVDILQKSGFNNINTWSIGHEKQLKDLVAKIGLPHFFVDRQIDLSVANLENSYNGHIPISAIIAFSGIVLGVLTGKKDVVVSNEWSANDPTLWVGDIPVNHQYSKSFEFEQVIEKLIKTQYGDDYRYYSLLRSLNELQISKIFSKSGFNKYKGVFSSCNKAFRQSETKISWCGECPKCCFVFLALSPFIEKEELTNVFGSNPLLSENNVEIYKELLGFTKNKPFECVGTVKESRWALEQIINDYPQLKNIYDLDFSIELINTEATSDNIPKEIKNQLLF
jgi:hypothetical protein